jgi:subtilisin family serine protease
MLTCAGVTGQWNLLSYAPNIPPTPHASGISADLAWQVTTGRPDTLVAILDSGVNYDHEDLRNKIWLNRGELPVPLGACAPPPGDPWDCNGDGVFDVRDYATDPRVSDLNGDGAVDRGDLRVFANGVDDDGDGYVDDLSGFDTDDDDGDEFDARFFGHGTGRAGILAPETNNGRGVAGVCPDCPLMNVRIDDTFVCSSDGVAKGAIFAVDHGASVISMSLGCTTASRLSRGAFDYATRKNVLAVNASANEFSFHQNFQAVFDDVMAVGAVTADNRNLVTTWLQKANFANYGAHLDVVAPTDVPGAELGLAGGNPDPAAYTEAASGTSSSTPHVAGVAALVFSRAHDLIATHVLDPSGLALQDISAQEVRQIINATADDVGPTDGTTYPVSVGWDKWTGYGRVNARHAVDRVAPGTIPPEADINAPDWYTLVDGMVNVAFYANARWATSFGWVLEVGAGVEPASFTTLATGAGEAADRALSSASGVDNHAVPWNTTPLVAGLYTLRLRVTDNLGNRGEDRMAVWVRHHDPQDRPGFPRVFDGSLESLSVALVDLDDDNHLEIVFADGNGEVHALRDDGVELPGFPVHTDLPGNLPLATSDAFDGNPANGEVPLSWSPIVGGVAVADLDRDGVQEIVVGAGNGKVYCWHADATPCTGFPVSTDFGSDRDPYPPHAQIPHTSHGEGIGATPALGDLDGDGRLEIVLGAIDQKLYVWHADGTRMAPFPKALFDASASSGVDPFAPRAILSSAAIADVDGDGHNDIVVGTNETYATPAPPAMGGSGRAYLVHADGSIAPGWPVKPTSLSPSAVPLVAEGVGTSPVVADLDGDGKLETIITAFIGDPTVYRFDGSTVRTLEGTFGTSGAGSHDQDETTPEGGLANPADQPSHFYVANGVLADLDRDGAIDYLAGSVGNRLLLIASGSGTPAPFDHLFQAWDATTGLSKAAFPRVIEDWQFLGSAAVADIGGADTRPEAIVSSGGYFVHAFDALGLEPAGWPKMTGQWQTSAPSVADLDDDGAVEVVQTSRLGTLFVWETPGAACQPDEWRKFRHDEWNTGAYGTDTRRPARITDFHVTAGTTLGWTAVGDDGRCGTATSYQLRASASPITNATFAAATPVPLGVPAAAGMAESATPSVPTGTRYLALRAVDEAGNAGPLATLTLPLATEPFMLRRIRAAKRGAGLDRLTVKARFTQLLAALGLPGPDVVIVLSDAGGERFRTTVPGTMLVANGSRTRVRFRDRTGTIAGGVTRLDLGGKSRTDLALRAGTLDLSALGAGPVTLEVDVGARIFQTTGTLRARGTSLVLP